MRFALLDELADPPEDVATAVPARRTPALAGCQDDLPAGFMQLLGKLHAGLARAHDQHPARGQLAGVPVVMRMDLRDPRSEAGCGRRDARHVECTGGDHHRVRLERAGRGLELEAPATGAVEGQAAHLGPGDDRRTDDVRVRAHAADHLVTRHEAVRVGPVIGKVGEEGREEVR